MAGWSIQSRVTAWASTSTAVLVLFGGDVGVVGRAASGHRGVDAAAVGGSVDEEQGGVDGAALVGVAGLGVAQLDVLGHVVGGEADASRWRR